MEEKCVGVTNTSLVNNETHSQTSGESTSSTLLCELATLHSSIQPTTSRVSSMSQLQEDDCSVSNSQHDFADVLDDETTTSGVLETFEISSSNSLPTSSDAPAVVVAVEDSSTADTIKRVSSDTQTCESSNVQSSFYNTSEVYIINDEDDRDIGRNDVEDENTVDNSRSEESANKSHIGTDSMERELNGVIMATDGSKIFLETPVVEEQVNYHPQLNNLDSDNQPEYNEKAGRPKRLSDEFMLDESGDQTVTDQVASTNCAQVKLCNIAPVESMEVATSELTGLTKGTKSELDATVSAETSHDRIMSVRLKKMSLTNTNASAQESSSCEAQPMPSSSQMAHQDPTIADIESMDLIERRDFETEQRLTGSAILKTSSILNKNMLNISLIKSCMHHQRNASLAQPSSSNASNEDWPSSSNGRVVSSDSKCTYKDLSSTPTSSRKHNSRLTKSTAKLNLCSTLSQQPLLSMDQPKQTQKSVVDTSCAQSSKSSLPSSVIVDPAASASTSTSNASTSTASSSSSLAGAPRTEVFNSNSNEDLATTAKSSCQQDNVQTMAQPSSTTSSAAQLTADGGCSRTSALQTFPNNAGYDDAQPSTSSARCHYAPPLRTLRQVNASAQTNERFLSRSRLGSITGCVTNLSGRSRGRVDSSVQTHRSGLDDIILVEGDAVTDRGEFSADDSWADCDEENVCSDLEEICTCQSSAISGSSHGGSSTSLNETIDMDGGESFTVDDVGSGDFALAASAAVPSLGSALLQRKRKYNEGRLIDNDYSMTVTSSGGSGGGGDCRKRIAYDFTSTPRSSQSTSTSFSITASTTPTAAFVCNSTSVIAGSPLGRRTPRSLIPTRDNPPPELQQWLTQFQRWTHAERLVAVDRLIDHCDASQVRHMMKVIEPQFQRDFISLLPRELALSVLSYLEPKDLLRAAQTCRSWRFLCDDNLLWKEKCRKAQILTEPRSDRPKRGRAGNMPPIASPWKAAYMRQHIIEMNWRSRPVRDPKVLKGHDDHVITCLQFSGNRIVSGSDDNTLKVWSAVTGRCLRTLVGHTGGVWSSQMSGNIIISGSTDRTLKVWDMETGMCVHTLQGHTSTVRCMHLHGNKVVSGSRDATLRVWDIDLGTCLHVLVGHLAAVRCVQYDGKLIVSGAYDYMVKIWHPERQECLHTLQGHTNRVYSLQFDGLHVVSGSLDTSIRVWDVETGNCKHTLMGHQSLTSGMELRQNILVSGNADSTVKVWDITTGQCLQTLSGPNKHQSAVTCLQFNSRFVVTSSDDGTVKLWDVNTGEFIRNLVALDSGGSGGVVWRIRANDTKLICAVGSRNGTEETKLMVLDFDVEGACVKCS